MHQRGFLLNTGDAPSLIEQGVVEIQRRPHMHQYASYMHIIATPGLTLLTLPVPTPESIRCALPKDRSGMRFSGAGR